jgi:acetylornithine/succinyldiaminopimelate/putrescine aminotransferase
VGLAAFIAELIQGVAGNIELPAGYLQAAAKVIATLNTCSQQQFSMLLFARLFKMLEGS